MIGREFTKHLRLRHGGIEIITTRFELDSDGALVEHVTVETQYRSTLPAALPSRPHEKDAHR